MMEAKNLLWKIKFDINCNGGCIKYHDDYVNLRFTLTLNGNGTVLAENHSVNWDYYDKCNAQIPTIVQALSNGIELTSQQRINATKEWNKQIR